MKDEVARLVRENAANVAAARRVAETQEDERVQFEQRIADMTKTMQEEIGRSQTEVATKDAKLAEMQLRVSEVKNGAGARLAEHADLRTEIAVNDARRVAAEREATTARMLDAEARANALDATVSRLQEENVGLQDRMKR